MIVLTQRQAQESGEQYLALNPTPLTGLANQAAPTTFDKTKGFITIKNRDVLGVGKSIFPDYVKLIVTAAGTGGTFPRMVWTLDIDTPNTKFTSGGTLLAGGSGPTPGAVAPNGRNGGVGIAEIHCGALVTIPGPAERVIAQHIYRTTIPVVGDEYATVFGGGEKASQQGVLNGTNPVSVVKYAPRVEIPPQWVLTGYLILPSQSAASSYEPEIAYHEAFGQ